VTTPEDRLRQVRQHAVRLTQGDRRTYSERVADALRDLADVVEEQNVPTERLPAWIDTIEYIGKRARGDWLSTSGHDIAGGS
jgi:hypothetical protein